MYRLIIATVLLAIVLLVVTLRRGGPGRARDVKVGSRVALHRGAYVAVVEVDGRRLLVGVGSQQVALLAELEPAPPAPAEPSGPAAGDAPAPAAPTSLLDKVRQATTRVPRGDR